jgi:hypothetical protein
MHKIDAEQVLSAKARVESGKEKGQLTFTFFLWLISSITITVATGVYLWSKDDDKTCIAPNSYKQRGLESQGEWVDVSRRFDDVLKIFFAVAITDVFRSFIMIIAVQRQNGALATLYQALVVNDVLGFGAVFVLHTFRFQLSGKICSGDFDTDATNYPYSGTLLKDQGRYLIGLVCFVWIVGLLLCLLSTCIALCQFKPLLHAVASPVIRLWKGVSFVHRLERGNQNDLLTWQMVIQAISSLAIFAAVASVLWYKEVDERCIAPYYSFQPSDIVDVSKRFRDVLKIWWSYTVADFARSIIGLLAVQLRSKWLAWTYQILCVNDLFGIGAVLILHSYRFQHSGKWCSGDFLDDDSYARPGYLIYRGRLFLGLVIYTWVGLFTYGCLLMGFATAASRRHDHIEVISHEDGGEGKRLVITEHSSNKPYDLEIQTTIAACSAASCGHLKILQRFYKIGISLDAGDYDKRTPLHIAASAGHLDVIKFLISVGVKVNPKDRWGSTPLNDAKTKEI